ncbi:hypothetical protein AB0D04_00505 [Streptomyces sp. NPDC048483]|uniref:hypothetical protein n=1 Tax=Streptomyces sp. NPDC048483 TaxID=3154927 RepID=UPI00341A0A58
MAHCISRCLARVRALLMPRATGRHRANPTDPTPHTCTCRARIRTVLVLPGNPPELPRRVRRHRPVEHPVDGGRSPLVRPYYAAYEEAEQRRDAELFGYEVVS